MAQLDIPNLERKIEAVKADLERARDVRNKLLTAIEAVNLFMLASQQVGYTAPLGVVNELQIAFKNANGPMLKHSSALLDKLYALEKEYREMELPF